MEKIIKDLSTKYDLPETAVRAIIESSFRFISQEIRKGEGKNFNLPGLCKFVVKRTVREHWKEIQDKINESKAYYRGLQESDKALPRDRESSPRETGSM